MARKSRARIAPDFDRAAADADADMQQASSETPLESATAADAGDDSRAQRIAERAYFLYLARGDQDGDPITDWLAAERQIQEEGDEGEE
jgi:hypothetical protein